MPGLLNMRVLTLPVHISNSCHPNFKNIEKIEFSLLSITFYITKIHIFILNKMQLKKVIKNK